MKYLYFFLVAFCLQAIVIGCTKNEATALSPDPSADQLSDEAVAILDTSRRANFKAEDLVLPGGRNLLAYLKSVEPGALHRVTTTPSTYAESKTNIIALMTYQAWWLTQDRTYPAGGTNEPLQTSGLGYILGGKDISIRQKSTGTCPEKLYGIDCSGLISNIAKYAHIANPPDGTFNQQSIDKWESVLAPNFPASSIGRVKDIGYVPRENLLAGDIIFFNPRGKNINHVGIILKTKSGELALFNSYGNGSNNCGQNYNYIRPGVKKGPTAISLYGDKNIENFLGSNVQRAKTLRITDEPGFNLVSQGTTTGRVGMTLTEPIIVQVVGADRNGQSGVMIKFDDIDNITGPNNGTFNPSSVLTDANGYAQTHYTLPPKLNCPGCGGEGFSLNARVTTGTLSGSVLSISATEYK